MKRALTHSLMLSLGLAVAAGQAQAQVYPERVSVAVRSATVVGPRAPTSAAHATITARNKPNAPRKSSGSAAMGFSRSATSTATSRSPRGGRIRRDHRNRQDRAQPAPSRTRKSSGASSPWTSPSATARRVKTRFPSGEAAPEHRNINVSVAYTSRRR